MSQYQPNPSGPGAATVVVGFERPLTPGSPLSLLRRDPGPLAASGFPRLEVLDDRIRLVESASRGQEWFKRDGGRVLYDSGRRFPSVYVGDDAGSGFDATRFDLERVRAAVLAHGWSWEADGVVTQPERRQPAPAHGAPGEPAVELVLKEHKGKLNTAALARGGRSVWFLLGAVALGLLITAVIYRFGPWSMLYVLGGASVAIGVLGAVYVARYQGLAVTISRSKLVVRTGSEIQTVERHRLVGSATVDRYGIKFKYGKSFQDEVYIPTSRRREELLARLNAFDWPLTHK